MPTCLQKQLCGALGSGGAGPPVGGALGLGVDESPRSMCMNDESSFLSCTTLNILAPIYKRLNQEGSSLESHCRESWLIRNERILELLVREKSSIICLQEFWLGNEELVRLYEDGLSAAGYGMFKLARTNNRGDGLFTAYRTDGLEVMDYSEILFYDCGDRVAQFLHMKSDHRSSLQELLVVNTHLLFPHNSNFCLIRLRQVYKILDYLEKYIEKLQLSPMPIILCGDWNGSKRGQVYKFLRARGFVSSYDMAHQYTDSDADSHRWVSHRNHRGNICGVDFIWLLNPSKHQRPLSECWKEAVFMIMKAKLLEMGIKDEKDTIEFFECEDATDPVVDQFFSLECEIRAREGGVSIGQVSATGKSLQENLGAAGLRASGSGTGGDEAQASKTDHYWRGGHPLERAGRERAATPRKFARRDFEVGIAILRSCCSVAPECEKSQLAAASTSRQDLEASLMFSPGHDSPRTPGQRTSGYFEVFCIGLL